MISLQFTLSALLSTVALLPFAAVELSDPSASRRGLPSIPFAWVAGPQLLPVPRDRDIRIVYWELRNESELWLTLEPLSHAGRRAPMLTITWRFAGRRPSAPPTELEVRAYASPMFGGRVEFWLILDGEQRVDLAPPGHTPGLISGTAADYVSHSISLNTLERIARARQVSGRALGVDFELTAAQRAAIAAFLERVSTEPVAERVRH